MARHFRMKNLPTRSKMRITSIAAISSLILCVCSQTLEDLVQAGVKKVGADVALIAGQAAGLDKAIDATAKSPGILGALNVHNLVLVHTETIHKSTNDLKEFPVAASMIISHDDAQKILDDINKFVPITEHALAAVAAAEPQFAHLVPFPVTVVVHPVDIVRGDILGLRQATVSFGSALIEHTPIDLKPTATGLLNRFLAAFDKAVAAYSQ